jgi:hypothetical protein
MLALCLAAQVFRESWRSSSDCPGHVRQLCPGINVRSLSAVGLADLTAIGHT